MSTSSQFVLVLALVLIIWCSPAFSDSAFTLGNPGSFSTESDGSKTPDGPIELSISNVSEWYDKLERSISSGAPLPPFVIGNSEINSLTLAILIQQWSNYCALANTDYRYSRTSGIVQCIYRGGMDWKPDLTAPTLLACTNQVCVLQPDIDAACEPSPWANRDCFLMTTGPISSALLDPNYLGMKSK